MYIYFNWTSLFVTTEMGLLLRLILFGVNILHSTGSFNAEFTRFHPKLSSVKVIQEGHAITALF